MIPKRTDSNFLLVRGDHPGISRSVCFLLLTLLVCGSELNAQAPPATRSGGVGQTTESVRSGAVKTNPNLVQPKLSKTSGEGSVWDSSIARPDGNGTFIEVPKMLRSLLERGGVPTNLEQLRLLESQQRLVARKADSCTVSVRIGPSQGCGVIITGSGYIVTAAHVAMRPGKIAIVTLSNGRQVTATTLGMNRRVDAGLMKINPGQNGGRPWSHASLGTSENLIPGMWCIALGHPGGYDHARGTVIRVGRLLEVDPKKLVSDCALIGGDSGGPLFNLSGELIAVHSRIGNDVADNLHVPIDQYDYAWERMAAGERWGFLPNFKPTLGVTGNSKEAQAQVHDVKKGSAAEKGGLQAGDIVERFGEKVITNFQSLKDAVADTMPGERVAIWVRRSSGRVRLTVEIGRSS